MHRAATIDRVSAAEATKLSRDEAMDILEDHSKREDHFARNPEADLQARGYNPVCGDRYDVFLVMEGDRIEEVRFHGFGCVISRASASIMAMTLEGRSRSHAFERIESLRRAVLEGEPPDGLPFDVQALLGVREHPSRIKCVLLPWQAAAAALNGETAATTE